MNKIFFLLVVAVLLITACTPVATPVANQPTSVQAATAEPATAKPAAEKITLLVMGPDSDNVLASGSPVDVQKKVLDEVVKGFLAENPDIADVKWDAQGPVGEDTTRLLTAHLAGQKMDLVACATNPVNGIWARKGVFLPLDDLIAPFKDRIVPSALDSLTVDGKAYGVPISDISFSTLYYNKNVFQKLGIQPPTTYEELVSISKTLKAAGYIPLLPQGKAAYFWPMWYFEMAAQTMGDSVAKTQQNLEGKAKFTDAADVKALQWIGKLVTDGVIDANSLAVDNDGMRSAFASQKAAIIYGGSWEMPWLDANVKDFEVGVFEFPKLTGEPGEPRHGGGAGSGICIDSNIAKDRIPYAVKFIEYLTRPDVATIYLSPLTPAAVAINGTKAVVVTPREEYIRTVILPHTIKFLDWIWPSEINNEFQAAIQGVVGGTQSAEVGMANVQKVYDKLVSEGYVFGK